MIESRNFSQNATAENPIASVLGVQGYIALNSVLLVLLIPPQLFLSILTIAGLCTGKTFRKIKAQRILLISIAAMGFVSSATEVLLATAEYLFLKGKEEAGVIFCHATALSYFFNTTMRVALLASLSVTVHITVKYGPQKIKTTYLYIALAVILVVVILLGFPHTIPFANSFNEPLDGVICSNRPLTIGYIGLGLAVAMVHIPARTITIGVVIATLVFVKKHHTSLRLSIDFKELKMALVKLLSCLITLNIIVSIGNNITFIPFIINATRNTGIIDVTGLAITTEFSYIFSQSASAIGTPLLMMAVFKPLRKGTKKILLKLCCCKTEKNITSSSTI